MKKRPMQPENLRFVTLIAITVGFGSGTVVAIGVNAVAGVFVSIAVYLIVLAFLSRRYE